MRSRHGGRTAAARPEYHEPLLSVTTHQNVSVPGMYSGLVWVAGAFLSAQQRAQEAYVSAFVEGATRKVQCAPAPILMHDTHVTPANPYTEHPSAVSERLRRCS